MSMSLKHSTVRWGVVIGSTDQADHQFPAGDAVLRRFCLTDKNAVVAELDNPVVDHHLHPRRRPDA